MSGHGWAEVGAVVFVVCAAGLWASVLSVGRERDDRRAERARETARRVRMETYRPMREPDWLKDDADDAGQDPPPRR